MGFPDSVGASSGESGGERASPTTAEAVGDNPTLGRTRNEGASGSGAREDSVMVVHPQDTMTMSNDGSGGGMTFLQAQVVAGKKAPTVAAQTERRDRKVIAAVRALAAQKSTVSRVGEGSNRGRGGGEGEGESGVEGGSDNRDSITVVWWKLEYALPSPKDDSNCFTWIGLKAAEDESYVYRKKVMMNVSGRAEPGDFLAVMGPEGSGKSLLLNMLAGRVRSENDECFRGNVLYNGETFSDEMRLGIGLVNQDSELMENLTVRETLEYAAQLRLPQGTEEIDRIVRVEHVLDSLELTQVADTVLRKATSTRNTKVALLNERRRLAIGVQMLVNPPLLLLDEPTSGLDGAMALRLTRALQSYAQAGHTVIASMKQPSNRMFAFFSHLLLMAEGNPIYFGPASNALTYFDNMGYSPSPESSPAEFFLDLTAPEAPDASIHFGTTTNLVRLWHTGETARALDQGLPPPQGLPLKPGLPNSIAEQPLSKEISFGGDAEQGAGSHLVEGLPLAEGKGEDGGHRKRWVTSWLYQFKVLSMRNMTANMTSTRHDSLYVTITAMSLLLSALLPGMMWYQRQNVQPEALAVRDSIGLIFFLVLFWGLIPMLTTVITFIQSRQVVRKELEDGVYHVSAYFASRTLLYLPMEIIPPFLFTLIVYWMAGLNPYAGRFVLFLLVIILECMVASSIGFFVGALSETVQQAIWTASLLFLMNICTMHFLVLNPPAWVAWSQYLSFTSYAYKLLLRVNYPGVDGCSFENTDNPSCIYQNGETSVELPWELYALPGNGWLEGGILVLMLIAYRLTALAVIRMRLGAWRRSA